jgi:hypothetical protein
LPADTLLGIFHALVVDVGLGIPKLKVRIRRLARKHLERMVDIKCLIVGALRWDERVAKDCHYR